MFIKTLDIFSYSLIFLSSYSSLKLKKSSSGVPKFFCWRRISSLIASEKPMLWSLSSASPHFLKWDIDFPVDFLISSSLSFVSA